MDGPLKKEKFLVVGGTRGAGLYFVKKLARAGAGVAVIGRRDLPDLAEGGEGVAFFPADLAEAAELEKTCGKIHEESGPPNHIVFFQRYRDEGDDWRGELEVSLTATRAVIEFFQDRFASEGERSVTIVGSVANRFVFPDQGAGYHVAKAGLQALTRYYAVALAGPGIRVNSVSPATILKEEAREHYESNPELLEGKIRATPLGRMGTPADVANAILFLSSPAASFITGHDLVVDGGLSLVGHEFLASESRDET